MDAVSNENEGFTVIDRDPNAIDVPCVFCYRTKRSSPELEFATNGIAAICTEHAEEALFIINNANRRTLQQLVDSMRRMWEERAGKEI